MSLFANMVMYIDGLLLFHNTTLDTELTADDQEVMSVPGGWVGITPSPAVRRITAVNVSPVAGEDYDFEGAFLNRTNVEVKLQQIGSGKQCITKGYVQNPSRSTGVGATATVSFTFLGTPTKFE